MIKSDTGMQWFVDIAKNMSSNSPSVVKKVVDSRGEGN
jgi:hypothetical protein